MICHVSTSEATPAAIDHVVENLWIRGAQELNILGISREQAVATMNHCREQGYPTMAWNVDGAPVFVVGLIPTEDRVMATWFLATNGFSRFQRAITITLHRELKKTGRALNLREIEIFSTCQHPHAARWFEALGFKMDLDRHSPPESRVRTYRFVRRFEGA